MLITCYLYKVIPELTHIFYQNTLTQYTLYTVQLLCLKLIKALCLLANSIYNFVDKLLIKWYGYQFKQTNTHN